MGGITDSGEAMGRSGPGQPCPDEHRICLALSQALGPPDSAGALQALSHLELLLGGGLNWGGHPHVTTAPTHRSKTQPHESPQGRGYFSLPLISCIFHQPRSKNGGSLKWLWRSKESTVCRGSGGRALAGDREGDELAGQVSMRHHHHLPPFHLLAQLGCRAAAKRTKMALRHGVWGGLPTWAGIMSRGGHRRQL